MTKNYCDRCGAEIDNPFTLKLPLNRHVDLCEDCFKELLEFLAKHE